MEVLSRLLVEKANSLEFKFHWHGEKTRIVNLCFVDDLMIFRKGDRGTIKLIKKALIEFQSLSGLALSLSKSHVFFSGVDPSTKSDILSTMGFIEGHLPVRYLGVPLISTKLKYSDCQILTERITHRIKLWTSRSLSYARRA
ncbi:hypothetical protein ACSBR2_001512 [Camellia fascicularis]